MNKLCVIFLLLLRYGRGRAGSENLYEPFEVHATSLAPFAGLRFEQALRGGYDQTACLRLLMSCWHFIDTNAVCLEQVRYASLCDEMHTKCYYNMYQSFHYPDFVLNMMETTGKCLSDSEQQYTRRRWPHRPWYAPSLD